jgi:hypothetical protein
VHSPVTLTLNLIFALQFSRWGGRVGMVCERYGMKAEDARARLQGLEWRRGDEQLAEDVLDEVIVEIHTQR